MRIAIVPASKLSTKDLRASAYVTNPRKVARDVVESWCKEYPVVSLRTKGGKRLLELVEAAIRYELDRNKPEKKQATKKAHSPPRSGRSANWSTTSTAGSIGATTRTSRSSRSTRTRGRGIATPCCGCSTRPAS